MQKYLIERGYKIIDKMTADINNNSILSCSYLKDKTLIIIDHEEIFKQPFEYKRYCQKQNEWMKQFEHVYRFIDNDYPSLKLFIDNEQHDVDFQYIRTFDREKLCIDPTPLEYYFEKRFSEAYGDEACQYLSREYSLIMRDGKTGYVDYALFHQDGTIFVVEENGVLYHHPNIIGKERYSKNLMKQNSVVFQGGKIYRWDTESIQNPVRVVDEIKEFFGDINNYRIQTSLVAERPFKLYKHQEEQLEYLSRSRKTDNNAYLIVLPTGTGKTKIALEDLVICQDKVINFNALVLVPTLDLKTQWEKKIQETIELKAPVEVITYAGICRSYYKDSPDKYSYIIFDEAHHSLAPTLRKVIKHYKPNCLLGLTATDKRLDEKQLETVFGEYEIKLSLREAIEKNILCQIRSFRLITNIDLSKVRFNKTDYFSSDLEKSITVPSRNEIIANTIQKYFSEDKLNKFGLVFCINIAHAKKMAKLLNIRGIKAASVDGQDIDRFDKIEKYLNGEIRFLCTCSLLTEGWDAPQTSVIVMARPTLSKALYTQQLGRGTRKHKSKEALYVVDVVDEYGNFGAITNRPWSMHALMGLSTYRPFGDLINRQGDSNNELVVLNTVYEKEMQLQPIDIFTMQQIYENHIGVEQVARELFVSTGSVINWILSGKVIPDVEIPVGAKKLYLFNAQQIENIRNKFNLKEHTEETIVDDFWEYIRKGEYTFSYKLFFMMSLLKNIDSTGEANIDDVLHSYQEYYLERFKNNQVIDRPNCPYNEYETVMNKKYMRESMLVNPFEKFERKRFMYYAKDLNRISIHHKIWDDLNYNDGISKLKNILNSDIENYYSAIK